MELELSTAHSALEGAAIQILAAKLEMAS